MEPIDDTTDFTAAVEINEVGDARGGPQMTRTEKGSAVDHEEGSAVDPAGRGGLLRC